MNANITFQMYLDDLAVYKTFGPHPERGKRLPFSVERTAGIEYSQFKGRWQPRKIVVNQMVLARRLQKGLWEVTVPKELHEKVKWWLFEKCSQSPKRMRRRRSCG